MAQLMTKDETIHRRLEGFAIYMKAPANWNRVMAAYLVRALIDSKDSPPQRGKRAD